MSRFLLIIVFLCQHIALAAQPVVAHLPCDGHQALMFETQPHIHIHQHDQHPVDSNHSCDDAGAKTAASGVKNPSVDDAAHEHAKHAHGHVDIFQPFYVYIAEPVRQQSFCIFAALCGITHTPPVPPPNT